MLARGLGIGLQWGTKCWTIIPISISILAQEIGLASSSASQHRVNESAASNYFRIDLVRKCWMENLFFNLPKTFSNPGILLTASEFSGWDG